MSERRERQEQAVGMLSAALAVAVWLLLGYVLPWGNNPWQIVVGISAYACCLLWRNRERASA